MHDTFKIVVSTKTKTYFMQPYKVTFSVFTSKEKYLESNLQAGVDGDSPYLVDTDIEDINNLDTMLYNAGFQRGTLDGIGHIISKPNINYTNVNKNDVMLAQYMLTADNRYLKEIDARLLYTLVQVDEKNNVYYPTIRDKNGIKILAYTSPFSIPNDMFIKYKDFSTIKVGQLGKETNRTFLVNNQFLCSGG